MVNTDRGSSCNPTGDPTTLQIDSGNAYLGSHTDLLTSRRLFYSRVGYCPQNDALLDGLTGRQTLVFFGRIRGQFSTKGLRLIAAFELKAILDKRVTTYSGGNRRKLSLAVALIGRPLVLLLDEPTTGVDPDSRLSIWCLLRDLMVCQKVSIVLTSHNMSECEALCSRLAIVSKGVLKAIGFTAHLKSFYAKGFDLIVKVKSGSNEVIVDEVKRRMNETFGDNCIEKYDNFGVIYYNLQSVDSRLSQIFQSLNELKRELHFEDYFVSNASLEQAFLHMIANQDTSLPDE
ncbi:unnamed protein product [Oppiella nova]|uniref:ABC transporter domain-containing protein n=1 Tax=Oppiella nova TaxID=334625 RepID=A0A7R9QG26_9ACAR|nr:unnamed protein product [Oppiella nova]CAG2165202.1 unnamed protein product [Oppiella nova]